MSNYFFNQLIYSMNGNERLLHQAFQNLITNAIKYSTTGGMVDVTLSQNLETGHYYYHDYLTCRIVQIYELVFRLTCLGRHL
jgi:signal transduction histidine kinase